MKYAEAAAQEEGAGPADEENGPPMEWYFGSSWCECLDLGRSWPSPPAARTLSGLADAWGRRFLRATQEAQDEVLRQVWAAMEVEGYDVEVAEWGAAMMYQARRWEEAEKWIRKGDDILMLGKIHEKLGRVREALKCYATYAADKEKYPIPTSGQELGGR